MTTAGRFVDEVGPRERIAWEAMKRELTEANARCVRLRHERQEARSALAIYGRHLEHDGTRSSMCGALLGRACTCGLDHLRNAALATRGES